jgi:hypothetical protein
MAKLTVQALRSGYPYDFTSVGGDVFVSVTDEQGRPVVELTRRNFQLTVLDPPVDLVVGSPVPVEIEEVDAFGLGAGFYRVRLRASSQIDWANFLVIMSLGIAVERNRLGPVEAGMVIPPMSTDNGQTVIALDLVQPPANTGT